MSKEKRRRRIHDDADHDSDNVRPSLPRPGLAEVLDEMQPVTVRGKDGR
jgi:hypothetical protein